MCFPAGVQGPPPASRLGINYWRTAAVFSGKPAQGGCHKKCPFAFPTLQIGDEGGLAANTVDHVCAAVELVLLKSRSTCSKFQLTFERPPWTIVRIHGTKVTVKRGGEEVFRNESHFKRFHGFLPFIPDPEGDNLGGDPEDIASPRDSDTGARPYMEEAGHERNLGSTVCPPAGGGVTAPVLTEGRSEKTRYNLRANLVPSSLLQDHVMTGDEPLRVDARL
ncbi:hypothetical protein NDU88_005382 [Pleurodeles waltl]|uniref:Uncharacterized protein n=1 Tax=Pleurodeles waltl TaxID=8319 RepID=A0AAV7LKZ4_PLEWA|nr:hypothetical protein NDU88_005382 [Pleurodeles waltl]